MAVKKKKPVRKKTAKKKAVRKPLRQKKKKKVAKKNKALDRLQAIIDAAQEVRKCGGPVGNEFWKARSKHGRDKIFQTPEILWSACQEYFQWIAENPLESAELVKYQGLATLSYVPKMRAMTVEGLCLFLDIGYQTWRDYAARDDFSDIITRAETVIRTQKFAGAAAEMLNPNIIARDLGLREGHEHSGPEGGPVEFVFKRVIVDPATGKKQ